MSKNKAIEVVSNLTATIKKMGEKSILKKSDNEMFHIPSVSKDTLQKIKSKIINKFKLKKEDYGL